MTLLSIPRKIKSQEVVKRGFMSNYLFQNIHNVFGAPQEVIDILKNMEPAKDEGPLQTVTPDIGDDLNVNENGDVEVPEENIIGTATEIFGDKIYAPSEEDVAQAITNAQAEYNTGKADDPVHKVVDTLKAQFADTTAKVMETAQSVYGNDMSAKTRKDLEKHTVQRAEAALDKTVDDYHIQKARAEAEHKEQVAQAETKEEEAAAHKVFHERMEQAQKDFQKSIADVMRQQTEEAEKRVVERVETDKKEKEKRTIEDDVRDHLRGFTRTIPSFLMAYGDDHTTLATFDTIIPDQVFIDVTSISLDNFRFLRDGGDYYERDDTGREIRDDAHKKHYEGHLFDEVVFDDSVKEFLNKKRQLADYFNDANKEDIFDYIPPQKTNQIFTPKNIVKDMVDRLEKENPGCFDDDANTFADLYMKSGMYITEIVKRLYNSPRLKALYPDDKTRLNHIFAKQVYGLAPTEIIYHICLSYILGFSDKIQIEKNNIRLCDALEYAKNGTLEMKLEELFPELKEG